MKTRFAFVSLSAAFLIGSALLFTSGCASTSKIGADGTTNIVRTIDPVRLQQAKDALEPAASSVLRRAIKRSPEHAAEIAAYARTIASVFCQMQANNNFSVEYLVDAADKATAKLQDAASEDLVDGKNAAVALYKIFAADQLSWQLPDNQWLKAICSLFCDSINQALKDSGQAAYDPTLHNLPNQGTRTATVGNGASGAVWDARDTGSRPDPISARTGAVVDPTARLNNPRHITDAEKTSGGECDPAAGTVTAWLRVIG